MEDAIVGMLSSESIHIVLVGVIVMQSGIIVVLWRKVNELMSLLMEVRAINVRQNEQLSQIKSQTNGKQ